eukprot:CAMPEP_0173449472 /NCGR_PEP_ID=MMETSP1357-20121228/42784_1 /TAXON_ID=77926 /ORGANISM="Hemiselmis rufescens, Strain PCC563" /LENGTH=400 /DNA_ID=CAMNT_0014416069 /DNA_START=15 /DNA_END=1214 /DNA_ORIENTATION=+
MNGEAGNLAEVLSALWGHVCTLIREGKARSIVAAFPNVKALQSAMATNRLMGHFDVCKDVCDSFGTEVIIIVHTLGDGQAPGFEVKRLRDKEEGDGWDDWDDDDDWTGSDMMEKYKDILNDTEQTDEEKEFEKMVAVPKDDKDILLKTRDWVNVIISDMGICPFSQSADKAGLPVGGVHYPVSRVKTCEECYEVYWREVNYLISSPEKDVSTTLLIIPEFAIQNVEGFTSFTDTLTHPLEPLGIEKLIQLVYFHPQWVFRDGADRMGDQSAANFARRSPFPMINILRTKQVRLAQKSIPTGLVYTQNEETLNEVGADKLQRMLVDRNWDEMADKRVDRRYNKLGKIAQMLMDTDGVPPEEVKAALDQQIADLEAEREASRRSPSPPQGGEAPPPPDSQPG